MLLLLTITVLSLFTVNSSAADEVDYNKSFAINIDGEYTYYSFSFLINPTWEDYIRYYKEANRTCDFVIVGDYVAFKNNLLSWQNNYVHKDDTIRAAAGAGIYKFDNNFPLIQINGDQLVFHEVFTYFNINFQYLIDNFENFGYKATKYGDVFVTYNGLILRTGVIIDDVNYAAKITDIVDSKLVYKLEEHYCFHIYECVLYVLPTCTKSGYRHYECKLCHNDSYVETIGIDKNTHINYNEIYKAPTCNTSGYYKLTCKDCHKVITYNYDPKGHTFTTPTMCYERPKCIDCGFETSEGMLVHDAGDGCDCMICGAHIKAHEYNVSGTCTRCGYTLPPVETSNVGEVIWGGITSAADWAGNGIKNTWNWITSGVSKGASAVGDATKDAAEEIAEGLKDFFLGDDGILTGATEVLKIVFLVMALALLVFVVIKIVILFKTKIVPQLKTRKTRKRRKRRK